jgi:hypothetical protein
LGRKKLPQPLSFAFPFIRGGEHIIQKIEKEVKHFFVLFSTKVTILPPFFSLMNIEIFMFLSSSMSYKKSNRRKLFLHVRRFLSKNCLGFP